MQSKKRWAMSKIKILQTDAFGVLARITKIPHYRLERYIINRLIAEDLLDTEETQAANKTLFEIGQLSGYTAEKLKWVLFPQSIAAPEINELMNSITFWGTDTDNPCMECGCKMDLHDHDYDYEGQFIIDIYKCTNDDCGHLIHTPSEREEITYKSSM